ncbi:unnamed protein product [Brachionus calyciflorus]|uniref:Uncharacterized protein n=1 Tax=Brachionus calyciflorus TaxID=104777 RepID=A0A813RG45_9BILA|nr:unnamed protein product [Brachionus calyciflorus]
MISKDQNIINNKSCLHCFFGNLQYLSPHWLCTLNLKFKEKTLLEILNQMICQQDDNLIVDLSECEKNILSEINLCTNDTFIDESALNFLKQLLDVTKTNSIKLHVPHR